MSFMSKAWHVPGYTGHIPTKKEEIGKSFGTISYQVISSDSVPRSKVSRTAPAGDYEPIDSDRRRRDVMRDHERKHVGTHLKEDMVPGYTGHVPRAREHIGASYSKVNTRGIVEHEIEQHYREEKLNHTLHSMEQREMERQQRISSIQPKNYNPNFYISNKQSPTFTPRVKYSQTVGIMPGATIFVPEKEETNLGKTFAHATQQSCVALRGKQAFHNTLVEPLSVFVSPIKLTSDTLQRTQTLGSSGSPNQPKFEKKHKSDYVF